ncbi:replication protein A 70 kDa DNA-binding subunit A-like isoform X1 [Primulina tabacum]|uniref:replication protein A 70 kDa DNA-binding subunit A-like isoform X1 n=2 Tax=Primulina tabacum TaxID=48773 RepID=UPI003F5A0516
MPPINLTEGAIALLSSGEAQGTDVKPVLQVADIRLVNTQNQNNNNERYRILLSDGEFTQQGMLATQRNELIRSEMLQKGSIVQLTQFVCNLIQNRMIIIIIDLDVILQKCDPIGEPKQYPNKTDGNAPSIARPTAQVQPANQPVTGSGPQFYASGSAPLPNVGSGIHAPPVMEGRNAGSHSYNSPISNLDSSRYGSTNAPPQFAKSEPGSGISRAPNSFVRPPQSLHNQPPPMFSNRGPVAKNEAPPRVIPIAALNPYQGRWTIKARVTSKGELKHYSNPRGDGKVFAFDLLDSDGGEIRVTCFNAVADQFYNQIEHGRVYMISKGSLKPAQKSFNHLRNDHEIYLESTSIVQPCFEDDKTIPQQQFHFCPICDIEGLDNNSVVDVIAVVSSINPSTSIMRKNGQETQKRTLQLKDMSGRSVELTLWGNFCNAEGKTLQNMCDSGVFPVLAVKSGRVNDFNGKSLGTISTSQLFIEPDFLEAHKLRTWFDNDGKNTTSLSISRDTNFVRTDTRKTVSQIKDEKLGTSEKPDWIAVSATLTFMKVDNFCYTACPIMIGDRQCNKKVTNNGDGKWRCDRCDKFVDECDYRYILQMQIQDHTGLTWVTAFQETGEEILGISAKDLYYLKYEEQDDDRFSELIRNVLFTKLIFKLKVKEETFSDEQRVKSTVVKADKVNFLTETKYLLDLIAKFKEEDSGSLPLKSEKPIAVSGLNHSGFGSGSRESAASAMNYSGSNINVARDTPGQMGMYVNQYSGPQLPPTSSAGMHMSCNSCGASGHSSANCPSVMGGPGQQSYGGGFDNKVTPRPSSGGASSECIKCHQLGHWAKDCPNSNNVPPAYGSSNATPGRYGTASKQYVGGF